MLKKQNQKVDGKAENVLSAVLSEAIQHPTTLFPAAVALLSGAYMGLIQLSPMALAMAIGGGTLSMCSVVFHYFVRGESLARKYATRQAQLHRQEQDFQFEDYAMRSQQVGFSEGVKQVRELAEAFTRLMQFLEAAQNKREDAFIPRFKHMAMDCRTEAMRLLETALITHKALAGVDTPALLAEMVAWKKQRDHLKKVSPQESERISALNTKIEANQRRLTLHQDRKATLEKILAEYEVLESALASTYLEVVELLEKNIDFGSDAPAQQLERAVAAARRVEDRLSSMEHPEIDDSLYSEAGKASRQR